MTDFMLATIFCWANQPNLWVSFLFFIFTAMILTITLNIFLKAFKVVVENITHIIRGYPVVNNKIFNYSNDGKTIINNDDDDDDDD